MSGQRCVYFSNVTDHACERFAALGPGFTALLSADRNLAVPGGSYWVSDEQLAKLRSGGGVVASWCDCDQTPYSFALALAEQRGLAFAGGQAETVAQYWNASSGRATHIIGNPAELAVDPYTLTDAIARANKGQLAFVGEVLHPDPTYSAQGIPIASACFYVEMDEAHGGYQPLSSFAVMGGLTGSCSIYTGGRMTDADWDLYAQWTKGGTPVPDTPWYQEPYPKGTKNAYAGKMPYPLYPPDSGKGTLDCPLTLAVKRAVSRAGRWPWQQFDDSYSNGFAHGGGGNVGETGVAGVQRQSGISATGWLGAGTFNVLNASVIPSGLPHAGEPLFDDTAVGLIKQAAKQGPPKPPDNPSKAFADFCASAEKHSVVWHYAQIRPYSGLGVAPDKPHIADCSAYVTLAYFWAHWPDPNHNDYNGEGFTGTLAVNPRTGPPYEIGDLAIYGSAWPFTEHVIACKSPGDANTARWSSHGEESDPTERALGYRRDLLGVVRPAKK